MRKYLLILLLITGAFSTSIIIDFPPGTQSDIYEEITPTPEMTAYDAFASVAALDIIVYSFGIYIEGVNGVMKNISQQKYWFFYVNNELAPVGVSNYILIGNETIKLKYEKYGEKDTIQDAFDWLKSNQKASGEIGEHKVWGTAFAVMTLTLFNNTNSYITNGLNYLKNNQKNDGGFEYPGYGSDDLHTAVVLLAFISAGQRNEDLVINGNTPVDYMLSTQNDDGGFSSWGNSDVDTTSWVMLSLISAGKPLPSKQGKNPVDYIISMQNLDGGFGYQGEPSAEDYTAEALLALASANFNRDSKIDKAIQYLKNRESNECLSNAYTTALAIIAFEAYDEPNSNEKICLESLQLDDGGFSRSNASNAVDTALAIIALMNKTLPLEIVPSSGDLIFPIGSIIKFTSRVENTGQITARNVNVYLNGIQDSWITGSNNTYVSRLEANDYIVTTFYVKFDSAGTYKVKAKVDSDQGKGESPELEIRIEGTTFNISLIASRIT